MAKSASLDPVVNQLLHHGFEVAGFDSLGHLRAALLGTLRFDWRIAFGRLFESRIGSGWEESIEESELFLLGSEVRVSLVDVHIDQLEGPALFGACAAFENLHVSVTIEILNEEISRRLFYHRICLNNYRLMKVGLCLNN